MAPSFSKAIPWEDGSREYEIPLKLPTSFDCCLPKFVLSKNILITVIFGCVLTQKNFHFQPFKQSPSTQNKRPKPNQTNKKQTNERTNEPTNRQTNKQTNKQNKKKHKETKRNETKRNETKRNETKRTNQTNKQTNKPKTQTSFSYCHGMSNQSCQWCAP